MGEAWAGKKDGNELIDRKSQKQKRRGVSPPALQVNPAAAGAARLSNLPARNKVNPMKTLTQPATPEPQRPAKRRSSRSSVKETIAEDQNAPPPAESQTEPVTPLTPIIPGMWAQFDSSIDDEMGVVVFCEGGAVVLRTLDGDCVSGPAKQVVKTWNNGPRTSVAPPPHAAPLDIRLWHSLAVKMNAMVDAAIGDEAGISAIFLQIDGYKTNQVIDSASMEAILEATSTLSSNAQRWLGYALTKAAEAEAQGKSAVHPIAAKSKDTDRQIQHEEPLPLLRFMERLHRLGCDITSLVEADADATIILEGRILKCGDTVLLKHLDKKMQECEEMLLQVLSSAIGSYTADEWCKDPATAIPIFPPPKAG